MIIKRLLTGAIKIITLSFGILISGFVISNSAFADTVDYNVNVAPSLKLTIPANSIILNLNPPTKTFDSEDFTVEVGTNNQTGYTLTLSTPNDDTFLNRDGSSDGVSAKLYTLDSGTYTETTFTPDKWGYSINSNTAIPSTITSGYIPFQSGNTLMESSTAVNKDETELTFAAKIDYLQPAGSYATQLNFNLVANPLVDYIQDFTTEMCQEKASSANYTVIDKRDNNDYTVRYINGACWMTQNLRYVGDTVGSSSTTSTWYLKSATSNVSTDTTMSMTDLSAGNTYDYARYHVPTSAEIPSGLTAEDIGVWYNYQAASAMTITGPSNTDPQIYDICPKGWRLPTDSEQSVFIGHASDYSPVAGGAYYDNRLKDIEYSRWWASPPYGATYRYSMRWNGPPQTLQVLNDCWRYVGIYIRCVAK